MEKRNEEEEKNKTFNNQFDEKKFQLNEYLNSFLPPLGNNFRVRFQEDKERKKKMKRILLVEIEKKKRQKKNNKYNHFPISTTI
jgi:hypothetical protein